MAAWPVVLRMNVDDYKCVRKIRKAVGNMLGVQSVWASPEQGLVVVHGTADPWALRRRIWRKMKRRVVIVSDGSAPYTATPHYGPSQLPAYGWGAAPPPHACYSHPPPMGSYPYAAGGYDGWAADPWTPSGLFWCQ